MNTTTPVGRIKEVGPFAQLFLRLALGVSFLWPVMDRLGWLGSPDSGKVAWGSWEKFVTYTNTLMPFLNRDITNVMAFIATSLEVIFGLCLIMGYKTRIVAVGGSILTMIFAISMAVFISPGAPLDYPVFVFSAANLLLATIASYKWSLDDRLA